MKLTQKLAAVLAASSMLVCIPQPAFASPESEAARLRELDIMLMVTSLRCRFGTDNFQPAYESFANRHSPLMGAAFHTLNADYNARFGARGAKKAMDGMSVGLANAYGQGHKWLDCAALKQMTSDLAATGERADLLAAADYALGAEPLGGAQVAVHR